MAGLNPSLAEISELLKRLHPQCVASGCLLPEARRLLATAQEIARQKGRTPVSQALWCDQGNHSFSSRDPKREHWDREVPNPSYKPGGDSDEMLKIPWDVCGACVAQINVRMAAIENEMRQAPAPPGGGVGYFAASPMGGPADPYPGNG